jgi:photosystem II stability/assembly factor-like uncharacterized protein
MKKLLLLFAFISGFGMNAQAFWTEVANIFPDPTYYAGEISIVDANVIWINGKGSASGYPNDNRKWAKSEDGGITWISGDYNMPVNTVVGSIKSTSATTAYVTTYSPLNGQPNNNGINGVWKTADSGTTWTQQNSAAFNSPSSFTNSIYFWNENEGAVVGDPVNNSFEIYTTTNGGNNWIPIQTSNIPSPEVNEYAYILNYDAKINSMWFGTNFGRIFKSNNKGLNWTVSQSPVTDFSNGVISANFTFKNETEGLLTDSDFNQWRTLDSGNTWTQEFPMGTQRNYRTESVPQTNNTYFQFGKDINLDQRGSSYSTDGGISWIDLNTEADPIYPFSVKFQSGSVGFCIGYYINHPYENGVFQTKFFRLTDPLQRLAGASLLTNSFSENKNSISPNPTSGIMKIFGNSISEVTIVDVLGKTVFSNKYNNQKEANLDISNLKNGVYIATISSEDGSKNSQKIIKN